MFVKFSDSLIFLCFAVCFLFLGYTESFGQRRKIPRKSKPAVISCGVCNQKAIFLPKPEYPKAAKFVGASGKVTVQILIDEKGNVVEAKAVSGHPLLRASSVRAAFKAKFEPLLLGGKAVRVNGTIVYNFEDEFLNQPVQTEEDAINLPIINGMATYLPKPEYPQEVADFCAGGKVEIKVLISENGDVIEAEAISGDELLRDVSIEAVKKSKFRKVGDMQPFKTKGIVVYNFPPVKKCIIGGIVNKKALNIPKPIILQKIKATGKVEVVIIIDSVTGTILSAKAISGHPLLRAACVASARKAKFSPVNDVPRLRLRATLIYNFKPDGKIEF